MIVVALLSGCAVAPAPPGTSDDAGTIEARPGGDADGADSGDGGDGGGALDDAGGPARVVDLRGDEPQTTWDGAISQAEPADGIALGWRAHPEQRVSLIADVATWDAVTVAADGAQLVAVGDLDRDGAADVAVSDGFATTVLSGPASSAPGAVVAHLPHGQPSWTGDVSGDGHADLLTNVTDGSGAAAVLFMGAISGALEPADAEVRFALAPGAYFPGAYGGVGDLDADGVGDLAFTVHGPDGLRFVELHAGGALPAEVTLGTSDRIVHATGWDDFGTPRRVGDTDGDGYDDLVVVNYCCCPGPQPAFSLISGPITGAQTALGGALFRPEDAGGVPVGELSAGDLDGDGLADVAVAIDGAIHVLYGPIDGIHTDADLVFDGAWGGGLGYDLDGDALSDLLLFSGPDLWAIPGASLP